MRSSGSSISCFFGGVAIFLAIGLAGCGDFCIAGFSANGTGQVNVNAGNPPPPCSLPHVNTMMRAVAIKSAACEDCSAAARVEHLFVTLQGIELHHDTTEEASSPTWIEIAPQFAGKPRQIDLIGNSPPELLQGNVQVPAGSYREMRLKLFFSPSNNAEKPLAGNACSGARWNCVILGNGEVEELGLGNENSELLLSIDAKNEGGSFILLPDRQVELQLRLQARQVFHSSMSGAWKPQMILAGYATIEPQASEVERTAPEM